MNKNYEELIQEMEGIVTSLEEELSEKEMLMVFIDRKGFYKTLTTMAKYPSHFHEFSLIPRENKVGKLLPPERAVFYLYRADYVRRVAWYAE
jgi:hypothetical protein